MFGKEIYKDLHPGYALGLVYVSLCVSQIISSHLNLWQSLEKKNRLGDPGEASCLLQHIPLTRFIAPATKKIPRLYSFSFWPLL